MFTKGQGGDHRDSSTALNLSYGWVLELPRGGGHLKQKQTKQTTPPGPFP